MKQLVCPISEEKIDSNQSRLTVFFNVILMGFFLLTSNPVFILVVSLDYLIRASSQIKLSPIRLLASGGTALLALKNKPIALAPKIFASRLGFLCALSSSILILSGFNTAALVVAGMLMALSIMDSVFNFCVGCIIYHYLVFPFYKNK